TLIFISHDVYFIRSLANHVVRVSAGQLTHYPGDYQYYLDKTAAVSERAALTDGGRPGLRRDPESKGNRATEDAVVSRKQQKRQEAERRQARSRERKAQQQVVHRLEKDIADLEARQAELTAELEKPETYEKPGAAMQINRELSAVLENLAGLTADWEEAASRLAEEDAQCGEEDSTTKPV